MLGRVPAHDVAGFVAENTRQLRFILRLLGQRLVEHRLVRSPVHDRQHVAGFDVLSLRERHLHELAIDAAPHRH